MSCSRTKPTPAAHAAKPHQHEQQQLANLASEPGGVEGMGELAFAAMLGRLLYAMPKQKGGQAESSQELCRNFLQGRCHRKDGTCKFKHGASPGSANSSAAPTDRKRVTCYNCQKVGYHVASECTAPKQERQRPRGEAKEVANHACR